MELIPVFEIGWLNGWLLLALLYLIMGILLLTFPKYVVARLYEYDRSSWSKRQRAFYFIGRLLVLICLVLIIFTPLKIGSDIFIPGIILFGVGLIGFIISLFNFKNTLPDHLVTQGIYRISRHPQVLMLFVLGFGICISIGSWLALFIQILASLFGRYRTLAEEQACLDRYGDSYQSYMKNVSRYFIF